MLHIKSIRKFISQHGAILFFHLACFSLFIANMHWGKYFLGWDSINPELNFSVNFQHIFAGMWQEHYGVGLLGGHGFSADLPHALIIWLLSLLLPQWALRTLFTFLCFYLGGLGMYILIRSLSTSLFSPRRYPSINLYKNWLALIPTFFYQFNFGTVQQFYVQLEAFIIHFAALPWLFWSTLQLLKKFSKKNLFIFFLINFLASAQGWIPPLFLTYMAAITFIFMFYIISQKTVIKSLKKVLFILLLTLTINAYWLTPFTYYTVNQTSTYLTSYNNLQSTNDFTEKSKKHGNLADTISLKGFYLDSNQFNEFILEPWINHMNRPFVYLLPYIFFCIILTGLFGSLFIIRNWIINAFSSIFILFFSLMATNVPFFSFLTTFLQWISPTYRQAFRITFTKFSFGLAFSYSIFFYLGSILIFLFFARLRWHKLVFPIFYGLLLLGIFTLGFPYFTGNMMYKRMILNIPPAYIQVINYFKNQPNGRIADFPTDCSEGWYSYYWNYFGSGFYWYGIKQPFMSRTFDVWSKYNENYYWEITQALRQQNMQKVNAIIDKYDITWILYDPNVLHCNNQRGFLHNEVFLQYLKKSPNYDLVNTFNSNDLFSPIFIFKKKKATSSAFISLQKSLPNIGPTSNWNDNDEGYQAFNTYYSDDKTTYDTYYPFRSLFTKRGDKQTEFIVKSSSQSFVFSHYLQSQLETYILHIPPYASTEKLLPIQLSLHPVNNHYIVQMTLQLPHIKLDNTDLFSEKNIIIGNIPKSAKSVRLFVNDIEVFTKDDTYSTYLYTQTVSPNQIIITTPDKQPLLIWQSNESKEYTSILSKTSQIAIQPYTTGKFTISIPKIQTTPYAEVLSEDSITKQIPNICSQANDTNTLRYEIKNKSYIRLMSQNTIECLTYAFPHIETGLSYILEIISRKERGNNPQVSVTNNRYIDYLDVQIPTTSSFKSFLYILPDNIPHEAGYNITLKNTSYNNDVTSNDFKSISLRYFPYEFITSLALTNSSSKSHQQNESSFAVAHPTNTVYIVHTTNRTLAETPFLIMYQGYHPGWQAYSINEINFLTTYFPFFFGKKITNHILINNWANGWRLPNTNTSIITIVFWPQYIQYMSYIVLPLTAIGILLYKRKHHTG